MNTDKRNLESAVAFFQEEIPHRYSQGKVSRQRKE